MEPGVLGLCRAALGTFAALGCTVGEVVPDFDPERLWRAWLVLRQWLQTGALAEHYRDPQRRTQMKPEAQWEVEQGLALTGEQVYEASMVRSAWYLTVLSLFQRFDFLLLPSAQVFPFDVSLHWPTQIAGVEMDTYHRWMQVVVPATMAGCPAISLPAGFNPDGLPMGIQAIGRPPGGPRRAPPGVGLRAGDILARRVASGPRLTRRAGPQCGKMSELPLPAGNDAGGQAAPIPADEPPGRSPRQLSSRRPGRVRPAFASPSHDAR
jgi:Amidase